MWPDLPGGVPAVWLSVSSAGGLMALNRSPGLFVAGRILRGG